MDWLIKYSAVLVPLALLLAAAAGYFFRRAISGQAHAEDQESLERAIRLNSLLNSEGMSLKEAKELREHFRKGSGGITKAEAEAIVAKTAEAEEREHSADPANWRTSVPFEHTTVGMGLKAREELDGLEGQLNYAVGEFAHECSEAREEALYKAQDAWKTFREAESDLASLLWEGGTGASLLYVGRMIELTEQRIKDIRLAQAEAKL